MRTHQKCARAFAESHAEDVARLVEQFSVAEVAVFLEQLPAETAASVIQQMSAATASECLTSMDRGHSATVIGALPAATGTALLRRIPVEEREALLSLMLQETRDGIQRLLSYPSDTVGSLADAGVLALPGDLSVTDARRQLRRYHGTAHHHVYVVDRGQRLIGLLHIRDLVASRSKGSIGEIMRPAEMRLSARSRLAQAAAHPAWREVDALPVTDENGVLLGMVRYRQLRALETSSAGSGLAGTLLGLGELYWLGLSTFLPAARSDQHDLPKTPAEGDHDHG